MATIQNTNRYQVGRMVYPTIGAASAAVWRAIHLAGHSPENFRIIDLGDGQGVAPIFALVDADGNEKVAS